MDLVKLVISASAAESPDYQTVARNIIERIRPDETATHELVDLLRRIDADMSPLIRCLPPEKIRQLHEELAQDRSPSIPPEINEDFTVKQRSWENEMEEIIMKLLDQ